MNVNEGLLPKATKIASALRADDTQCVTSYTVTHLRHLSQHTERTVRKRPKLTSTDLADDFRVLRARAIAFRFLVRRRRIIPETQKSVINDVRGSVISS